MTSAATAITARKSATSPAAVIALYWSEALRRVARLERAGPAQSTAHGPHATRQSPQTRSRRRAVPWVPCRGETLLVACPSQSQRPCLSALKVRRWHHAGRFSWWLTSRKKKGFLSGRVTWVLYHPRTGHQVRCKQTETSLNMRASVQHPTRYNGRRPLLRRTNFWITFRPSWLSFPQICSDKMLRYNRITKGPVSLIFLKNGRNCGIFAQTGHVLF